MRVSSIDSRRAEWRLTKPCRHNPWVPTMVFHQKEILKKSLLEGGESGI